MIREVAWTIYRDVIFPFFSGIPVFSNQIDHPRESRRSVEIFLDQYRGVGVFIPRDKCIRIGLFCSVNRPFVASRDQRQSLLCSGHCNFQNIRESLKVIGFKFIRWSNGA